MCDQHEMRPLPDWLEEKLLAGRCLPVLGVHERCEHDGPPVRFPSLVLHANMTRADGTTPIHLDAWGGSGGR